MCLAALGAVDARASADLSVNDTAIQTSRFTTLIQFTVTRSGDTGFPVSVDYATKDGSATAGRDYVATSGTLSFAAGQLSQIVNVTLVGKPVFRTRTFTLDLSNASASPSGAVAFGSAGVATIAPSTENAAIADFNGDGKLDVVLTASGGGFLQLLRNDTADKASTANFASLGTLAASGGPYHVGVADLNRDGRPDLVVAAYDTTLATIFMNATPVGSPTFSFVASKVQLPSLGFTTDVSFADFDGDGIVDVALANPGSAGTPGSNRALVLRNTTPVGAAMPVLTVVATPQGSPSKTSYSYTVRSLDVNGDGKPDLAVGNLASGDVSILMNITPTGGAINFAPAAAFNLGTGVSGLETADVNGDGKPDLVTANNDLSQTGTTFSVLLNQTAVGSVKPTFSVTTTQGGAPYTLALSDVNGDGKLDILIANLVADSSGNGAIDVYLNQTAAGANTPTFTKTFSAFVGDEPHFVRVADFNHDGLPDFVSADYLASLANFQFALKPVANPQAKIVDASGTATLTPPSRP